MSKRTFRAIFLKVIEKLSFFFGFWATDILRFGWCCQNCSLRVQGKILSDFVFWKLTYFKCFRTSNKKNYFIWCSQNCILRVQRNILSELFCQFLKIYNFFGLWPKNFLPGVVKTAFYLSTRIFWARLKNYFGFRARKLLWGVRNFL